MYGKLNVNEYVDGQHLWYETCFGNGKFILVVDRHNKYDVRDLPSLAEKPRPSGRGWIGKKSDCLIYYTIIILKISKYGDFQ